MPIWDQLSNDPMSLMMIYQGMNDFARNISRQSQGPSNLPPGWGGGGGQQQDSAANMLPLMLKMRAMNADQQFEQQKFDFAKQQALTQQQAAEQDRQLRAQHIESAAQALGVPAAVLDLNPDAMISAYSDRLKAQKLGPGDRLYFGDQMAAENPALLQNVGDIGWGDPRSGKTTIDPKLLAAKLSTNRASAPVSNTAVYNNTEGAFDSKVYGAAGQAHVDLVAAAKSASERAADLERIDSLLADVPTGTGFDEWKMKAKKILGVDLGDVSRAEAAATIQNAAALKFRSTGDGGGMPGNMSDADREFLRSMTPGIETTPQGRKLVIETQKADEKFARGLAGAESRYLQDKRKAGEPIDPYDIEQFRMAYAEANPRYKDLIDKYKSRPTDVSAPPPPDAPIEDVVNYYKKKK